MNRSTTRTRTVNLSRIFLCALAYAFLPFVVAAAPTLHTVGVAAIDITPDYPVRLSGYGSRRTEHEGVDQRIKAKALAIGGDKNLAILLTVDNSAPGSIFP